MPRPVQDIEEDLALAQERVLQYERELSAVQPRALTIWTPGGTRLAFTAGCELSLDVRNMDNELLRSTFLEGSQPAALRDWLNYHYPQEASC